MNFIKPFLGILLSIWLISCKKEEIFKENYTIGVENQYFETIDSVKIGENTLKKPLFVNQKHFFSEKFPTSDYKIEFYTASNLMIKTKFKAISHHDTILLTLSRNGKINAK